jgi:hypothetical protein
MDDYYFFFDRSKIDSLWSLSWQEFLRLYGRSGWAKGRDTGRGGDSLRALIAFSIEPKPSAAEVEDIISRHSIRWTIQHSSPQFYTMEEIIYNVASLSAHSVSLDTWPNDFTVLLAAAAEGYFCGEVPVSEFKAVLKLHYSKFEDFIRLSKRERAVVRQLMGVEEYAKPIYPWQGEAALLDEQWAGCLGVADTRRLFRLVDRCWNQNLELRRMLSTDEIQLCNPKGRAKTKTRSFQDFGISRQFMNLWSCEIRSFTRPCVFRRWE